MDILRLGPEQRTKHLSTGVQRLFSMGRRFLVSVSERGVRNGRWSPRSLSVICRVGACGWLGPTQEQ